ncbi:MAG: HAD-IIIC family phosphatase [Candidatus Kaiserbacteria bacterium]|nr:HAD-IIIC family phosphatase [Candidatus Kaiserbacteria bacterium]
MDSLAYIQTYARIKESSKKGFPALAINLITNFTDEVLEKVLGGMCLTEGIYPNIVRAPYKQYHLVLKDTTEKLYAAKPNISFLFFDINPYQQGEFTDSTKHVEEIISDVRTYCETVQTLVVMNLSLLPYNSPYGHFFADDPLFAQVRAWNDRLIALSKEIPNLYIFDTNKLVFQLGEDHIRDMRNSYAFDIPFTNDFFVAIAREWLACIQANTGRVRKCIVLDLDNTLWGGVVGESGARGIALGPGYPGVAFQNFQRTLLKLWERGIILAIASKNNLADVQEVFEKNPHMILKEEHFAALRVNWDDKSDSIADIAKELNIGIDSMVFIDDSPLERERMRKERPEILVPEFPAAPEAYINALVSLNAFHQMSLTEEDKRKGKMYAEERQRVAIRTKTKSKKEYLAELGITLKVFEGTKNDVARVSQLTQKTNQFNLTTKRYSEADIRRFLSEGWHIYSAEVSDTFGAYGIVIVACVAPNGTEARLDTFLMSCRVMGRDVEYAFLEECIKKLSAAGFKKMNASFIPTAKNIPAKDFLKTAGFTQVKSAPRGTKEYTLTIRAHLKEKVKQKSPITILS